LYGPLLKVPNAFTGSERVHIRDYLLTIGTRYDRNAGLDAPAQALLRRASIEIGPFYLEA